MDSDDDGTPAQVAGRPRPLQLIIVSGLFLMASLFGALVLLVVLFRWLDSNEIFALPMLLLAAVVLLLAAIAVLVNVYKSVGLDDRRHALGLPEGSIRAIIALTLVFLFFVAVTYIYSSFVRGHGVSHLRGLTAAQFAQIAPADLLSSTTRTVKNVTSYDVVVRRIVPAAAQDVGKNLVVLLGTLITAVAAFYFGSNSATSAAAKGAGLRAGSASPAGPRVTSLDRTSGPESGGDPVVIAGTGFASATALHFGTQSAHLRVVSDTRIEALAPAGTGTVAVVVTTPTGSSGITEAARYTYLPATSTGARTAAGHAPA